MKVKAKEAITIKLTPAEAAEFLKDTDGNFKQGIISIRLELQNLGIKAAQ